MERNAADLMIPRTCRIARPASARVEFPVAEHAGSEGCGDEPRRDFLGRGVLPRSMLSWRCGRARTGSLSTRRASASAIEGDHDRAGPA